MPTAQVGHLSACRSAACELLCASSESHGWSRHLLQSGVSQASRAHTVRQRLKLPVLLQGGGASLPLLRGRAVCACCSGGQPFCIWVCCV